MSIFKISTFWMKVLFTIAGLQSVFGGPSRSVPALASALAGAGAQVELLTCESLPGEPAPLLPPRALVTSHLLPHSCRSTRWFPRTNAFAAVLRECYQSANDCVIHDHGLWLPTNHAVAFAARTLGVPRIVSPRGMLSNWALHHRGLKKRVAWWLYQKHDLATAQALHATSAEEAAAFRAAGLTQPIAIIPNGVEFPPAPRSSLPAARSSLRTALFLGRIHPIKGLLNLVNAWAQVRPIGWRLVIAGRDEAGHSEVLKAESRKQKVENDFEFVGPVEGQAKWDLYRSADLFVLPSHSENFGIVVAEALACGVPVITTKGTPWESLVTQRCGWWTELGSEPLAAALREATSMTDAARQEMGQRGRELVEREFSWPRIAEQMLSVYRWMLGQGPKPDCVSFRS